MTSLPKVSLCMIVKNEAEFILDCLESARDAADEMIVLDTGSSDETAELARRAGAEVFHYDWADDFAAARNASIERATGDWVLILDADERLAPRGAEVIRFAVQSDDFDCGLLMVHNAARLGASNEEVVSGHAREGEPRASPRLCRRTADLRYEGAVHENLDRWVHAHPRIGHLEAHIVHLGYVPELREARGKRERNVGMLEQRAQGDPEDLVALAYLAQEYLAAGRVDEAWGKVEAGWEVLQRLGPVNRAMAQRLAVTRAHVQLKYGRDAEGALESLRLAERWAGPHPDADLFRGSALELAASQASEPTERRARLEAAAQAYQAALQKAGQGYLEAYVKGSRVTLAWKGLGSVAASRGKPERALQCFGEALGREPRDREAQLGKAEALGDLGRSAEALAAIEPLLDDAPDAWLVAALVAEGLGQIEDVSIFFARARDCVSQTPYSTAARADQHVALLSRLSAYLEEPVPGPGAVGAACAIMAGEGTLRPAEAMDPREGNEVALLVRNLLRLGRPDRVQRLLTVWADAALPGVSALVRKEARELAVKLPQAASPAGLVAAGLVPAPGPGGHNALPYGLKASARTKRPTKDPLAYSILIPTNRAREHLLPFVMANIRQVFRGTDFEICIGDVSGKEPPDAPVAGSEVVYVPVEKPEGAQIYLPISELVRASSNDWIIIWNDDLLFCRGYPEKLRQAIAQGQRVIQTRLVDPELYVVISRYQPTYGPCVIPRDLALLHLDQLRPGSGGDLPFIHACMASDGDRYAFLDNADIVHMGYPVGKGADSTLFEYVRRRDEFDVWKWLQGMRKAHGFKQVAAERFPYYDDILRASDPEADMTPPAEALSAARR